MLPTTVADLRGWLKRPHTNDDPEIAVALRAVISKWKQATNRDELTLTEEEWMAIKMEVAHIEAFRGDDPMVISGVSVTAPMFVETVRRMHNGNAVG